MFASYYNSIIRQDLLTKFSYKNINELPQLEQIVLTFSLSQVSLKSLLPTLSALMLISSQKPAVLMSKRPQLVLKTRGGVPIGCKVNLRGLRKFLFLEKLIFSIFPRIKSLQWSYSEKTVFFRLENVFFYKEIEKEYDHFQDISKLDINFVFKAKSKNDIFILLSALKFPTLT